MPAAVRPPVARTCSGSSTRPPISRPLPDVEDSGRGRPEPASRAASASSRVRAVEAEVRDALQPLADQGQLDRGARPRLGQLDDEDPAGARATARPRRRPVRQQADRAKSSAAPVVSLRPIRPDDLVRRSRPARRSVPGRAAVPLRLADERDPGSNHRAHARRSRPSSPTAGHPRRTRSPRRSRRRRGSTRRRRPGTGRAGAHGPASGRTSGTAPPSGRRRRCGPKESEGAELVMSQGIVAPTWPPPSRRAVARPVRAQRRPPDRHRRDRRDRLTALGLGASAASAGGTPGWAAGSRRGRIDSPRRVDRPELPPVVAASATPTVRPSASLAPSAARPAPSPSDLIPTNARGGAQRRLPSTIDAPGPSFAIPGRPRRPVPDGTSWSGASGFAKVATKRRRPPRPRSPSQHEQDLHLRHDPPSYRQGQAGSATRP